MKGMEGSEPSGRQPGRLHVIPGTERGGRWEQGRGSSGLRESVGLDGVEEETGDTTMAEKRGNEEKKRPTYMEQSIPKLHPGQSGIHPQSEGQ